MVNDKAEHNSKAKKAPQLCAKASPDNRHSKEK